MKQKAQCGACARAIFISEQFPTGTYNRAFPFCQSEESDQGKFCHYYCKGRGYREGRCILPSASCYCSWTNQFEETFQPILTNEESGALLKETGFSKDDGWTLIYDTLDMSRSITGFTNKAFHDAVDNKTNTLTIVRVESAFNTFILGAFVSVAWDSTSGNKKDENAFIFSLANTPKTPRLFHVKNGATAIFCRADYGPSFGDGQFLDFAINAGMASGKIGQSLYFGLSYFQNMYPDGSTEALNYLAGSPSFTVKRMAVFQLAPTS